MKKIICKLFGHKEPNYKRAGCFMYCKRCKELLGLVGDLYGIKYTEKLSGYSELIEEFVKENYDFDGNVVSVKKDKKNE